MSFNPFKYGRLETTGGTPDTTTTYPSSVEDAYIDNIESIRESMPTTPHGEVLSRLNDLEVSIKELKEEIRLEREVVEQLSRILIKKLEEINDRDE